MKKFLLVWTVFQSENPSFNISAIFTTYLVITNNFTVFPTKFLKIQQCSNNIYILCTHHKALQTEGSYPEPRK